jgi:hypothetical protein
VIGAFVTATLSGLGRRAALWSALAFAIVVAAWSLNRHGRHQAEADLAIRQADARVRAMQTSKETRHEVQNADRADLDDRADRWMRD